MRVLFLILLLFFSNLTNAKEYNFIIKQGDTLSKYFQKLGLSNRLLINLINNNYRAQKLQNLKLGKTIKITIIQNKFKKLKYKFNNKYSLVVGLNGVVFTNKIIHNKIKNNQNIKKTSFKISKNLFYDGKKAGLNFTQIQNIAIELKKYINLGRLRKNNKIDAFFQGKKLLALKFYGRKKIVL